MQIQKRWPIAVWTIFTLFFLPSMSFAEEHRYRKAEGLFFKGIAADETGLGCLLGVRGLMYFSPSSPGYGGINLAYGQTSPNSTLGMASLVVGAEALHERFVYGAELGAGVAEMKRDGVRVGSAVNFSFEPQAHFGFLLGHGWRVLAAGSYLDVPSHSPFSGMTFGIRIERKTELTSKGVD